MCTTWGCVYIQSIAVAGIMRPCKHIFILRILCPLFSRYFAASAARRIPSRVLMLCVNTYGVMFGRLPSTLFHAFLLILSTVFHALNRGLSLRNYRKYSRLQVRCSSFSRYYPVIKRPFVRYFFVTFRPAIPARGVVCGLCVPYPFMR